MTLPTSRIQHFAVYLWRYAHQRSAAWLVVDRHALAPLRCLLLPRWMRNMVARRAEGSGWWALAALCVGIVLVFDQFLTCPRERTNPFFAFFDIPLLCALIWLLIASTLIKYALRVADAFELRAQTFLTVGRAYHQRWAKLRHKTLAPQQRRIITLGYLLAIAFALVVFRASGVGQVSILHAVVLAGCFHYGGFGLWGSYLYSCAVVEVCRQARGHLDLFHLDGLGGLEFARRYADMTSLLLSSGILLVPLGVSFVWHAHDLVLEGSLLGLIAFGLSCAALASWVIFTALAGLRGRCAIAKAMMELRDDTLVRVLKERAEARLAGGGLKAVGHPRAREERAAFALKTGIIASGAWREVLSFGIAITTALASSLLKHWMAIP